MNNFPTVNQVTKTPDDEQVIPFPNGTSAMMWSVRNCDRCVKACHSTVEDDVLRGYVRSGKMCKYQYFIGLAWLTGFIPLDICKGMGYDPDNKEHRIYFPNCILFSSDDNDRWHPPKRPKPDKTPPNQLLLFTEFDELLKPKKELTIKL